MRSDELPFEHPWDQGPISEYADVIVGGTPSTEIAQYWGGNIEWMVSGDVHLHHIFNVPGRITTEGLAASAAAVVEPQAVAMALAGQGKTRGTVALTHVPLCTNQSVALIKPRGSRLNGEFLFQSLIPRYEELRSRSSGGGRAGLTKKIIERTPIQLPPIAEQREIVTVLAVVDEAILQTASVVAKLERIQVGLEYDLLTRGILDDGSLRPSSTIRQSSFGWMPKDWRIGSLADATSAARQPILTGPFGADLGSNDFVDEGVPVLRIGNVQARRLDLTDLLFISEAKASTLLRYRVSEGDLLFARQGATTGRNALADHRVSGWIINYHIIRVALDSTRCAPRFVEAAFNGEMVKRQIERDKGRGTREGISGAQLKALEIPLPDVDEQRRIARILTGQSELVRKEADELDKLRLIKLGLMQDLLKGRVRVPVDVQSV